MYYYDMTELERRSYAGLAGFVVVLWVLLFLPALTLNYWQAWVYWAVFTVSVLIISVYFLKHDPALVERRLEVGPAAEQEASQKVIQAIAGFLFILLMVLPGLDHLFGWSHVPVFLVLIGDVLVAIGFAIIFFVFKENSYTSATIETHAGQTVISTGPYSIVRHPMYLGALFLFVGTPLALGSYWTLIVGALLGVVLGIRLLDEEKFLDQNLAGYPEYRQKTRYHLIPLVW
jgi:protein-S-isoprenylcysteine O-methyltransferase Ste14